MTDIRVRGGADPLEIAAVVALLGRDPGGPPDAPTGVAAWQQVRRAALRGRVGPGRTVSPR